MQTIFFKKSSIREEMWSNFDLTKHFAGKVIESPIKEDPLLEANGCFGYLRTDETNCFLNPLLPHAWFLRE